MNYDEFLMRIQEDIKPKLEKGVNIRINTMIRNNNTCTNSISFFNENENLSPAIALEPYYRLLLRGKSMDMILDEILSFYQKFRVRNKIDTDFFLDFTLVRERIVCRVIDYEKNREMLKKLPHRRFLDLAIIYYYMMDERTIEDGTIQIQEEHRRLWNVAEEDLYKAAMKNVPKLLPSTLFDLIDMLNTLAQKGLVEPEEEELRSPMYVLTNETRTYGAVYMVFKEVLEKAAKVLGGDFYLLPSSVHECILVPSRYAMEENEMQKMVQEINMTQVEKEEVLSDSVYRYLADSKSLALVCSRRSDLAME